MQQVNFKQAGLRTKLDVLKPDVRKRVEDKQLNEAVKKSQNPAPNFQIGQNVIARNYRGGDKWVPGIIAAQTGPLSYQVELHQATGVKADIHEEQPGPTRKPEVESDDENARNINPDTSSEETPTDNPSNNTTEEEPRPPCNTDQARRYLYFVLVLIKFEY